MGAVTGKGLADLTREKFGVKATFYLLIGLLIANLANTVGEFAGVAAAGEVFGIFLKRKESSEKGMGSTEFTGLMDYSLSIPPREGAGGAKNLKAADNKKGSL
jgi:hypothetical protein